MDECKSPNQYACYGVCKNTPGNFTCHCKTGYTGNASVPNGCTGTYMMQIEKTNTAFSLNAQCLGHMVVVKYCFYR